MTKISTMGAALATLLLVSGGAHAVTTDIAGKTYEQLNSSSVFQPLAFSSELGSSSTMSYAWDFGVDYEAALQNAVSNNLRSFGVTYLGASSIYLSSASDSRVPSAFSVSDIESITYNGRNYALFNVTFAPTASLANTSDVLYIEEENDAYLDTSAYNGGSLTGVFQLDDFFFNTLSLDLSGTITSPAVAPVPVPAPFLMLGMAMLGLIGFGRRAKA